MTIPTYQSYAMAGTTTASLTIAKPSGTVAGDFLFATLGNTNASTAHTLPTGWTLLDLDLSTGIGLWTAYKVAGASEPTTYTFTWTTNDRTWGAITRTSGVVTVDTKGIGYGAGVTIVHPSITTTLDDCILFRVGSCNRNLQQNGIYGSGTTGIWARYINVGFGNSHGQYDSIATAGVTGNTTLTGGVVATWTAGTYAFSGLSGGGGGPSVALLRRRGRA